MSRDPAGAVLSSAYQRIECFCRTRIFTSPLRWLIAGLLLFVGGASFSVESGMEGYIASEAKARSFTLTDAIQFAFQHNPAILTARQEIRRNTGLQIQVRAEALPHLDATAFYRKTDPNLRGGNSSGNFTSTIPTPTPALATTEGLKAITARPSPTPIVTANSVSLPDNSYDLTLTASQLLYNGSVYPAIRGAGYSKDASLFSLRNTIDQIIATVRQQFYLVILDRSLIGVQEESVHLLEQQLQDQQNRFEAGTVPRFNVLQAEVALANQQPALITARNNYRIAQLQLAKTIGLDYDPHRRAEAPLRCVGELTYLPREIPLALAVQLGKERRPLLKQQRANVLVQLENVHGAYAGFQPMLSANAGYEWTSSELSDSFNDINKGWFFGVTGSWPIFDGLATVGIIKQQKALLSESRISYDDAVRQVELEVQQAYSNLQQDRELYFSQTKNVDQAREALRLASARLGVGAGVQLDVLNAQVQLTQAQSTRLSALYSYNADLAEFDRATATDTIYHNGLGRGTRMIKTESSGAQSSGK